MTAIEFYDHPLHIASTSSVLIGCLLFFVLN